VEFNELPTNLVNALIASEDQRFYKHWGVDPVRIAGAGVANIKDPDHLQGGSTITQQLARNFFLTPDRLLSRKLTEAFIAVLLEQRVSKQQILTMYSNEVYLGERGSFSIHGFAEGAAAFFGKDLTGLTLPEAATLVGVIPAPNRYSPANHPEAAKKRRDLVLRAMNDLSFINKEDYEKAKETELKVAPAPIDATDAPYMIDYAREQLTKDFSDEQLTNDNLRVYTTLDPNLQRIAVEAVKNGVKAAEETLAARDKGKKNVEKRPPVQASLIVMNPHTGEILAMVGGRDYTASQFNRITQAKRQPGSIFKPFVYAAAFETAEHGEHPAPPPPDQPAEPAAPPAEPQDPDAASAAEEHELITAVTMLDDVPTVFYYDRGQKYEPNNYKQEYMGQGVTVSYALQHSLNVPTIQLAERIGYGRVVALARRAGLNEKIKAYPSVSLGAFEVTPIEMAGAYTIFANEGKRMEPHVLVRVADGGGKTAKAYTYDPKQIISPQLAYLMTYQMEGVVRSGTGAGVRARGFTLPAAGKTGTSRDGWFAGYTKDFLAIAWMGYDDNRDLNLEGARSALPIWTEFMQKAAVLYPPADINAMAFVPPDGIQFVRIDSETKLPATSQCPETYQEAFLEGAVPVDRCPLHRPSISNIIEGGVNGAGRGLGRLFGNIGRAIGGVFESDEQKKR
jgi:penicillin-binding protein 1B